MFEFGVLISWFVQPETVFDKVYKTALAYLALVPICKQRNGYQI